MSEAGINRNLVNDFLGISANQATGILYVYEGENIKYLYFEGGKLIYLSFYVSKSEKIGNALLESYKITQDQLAIAYQQSADTGVDIKQILMDNGMATDAELKDVTRSLVEDEFCMMFQWHGCQTSFVEGEPDPQIFNKEYNTLKINIDVENLIKWIEKKIDENATIDQWIPSKQNVYALMGEAYDNMDQSQLSPLEMKVAEFLDGNYTVENICFQLRQHFYKIGKALVKLMSAGVAELVAGEGPTTGVRQQIQDAQAGEGVPMQQAAIAAAGRTPQMEELEDEIGTGVPQKPHHAKDEPAPEEAPEEPGGGAHDSARNILTYESNTKRNVIIAASSVAGLAIIGFLIWFFAIRMTPEKKFAEVKALIPEMTKNSEYDQILSLLEVVKNFPGGVSDVLRGEVEEEYQKHLKTENNLVDLAIQTAENKAAEKDFAGALKVIADGKKNKTKADNYQKLLDLEVAYEQQQKKASENVAELHKKISGLLAAAQASPTEKDMAEIAKVLDIAVNNYKGFKDWEEKKQKHLDEYIILSNEVDENFTAANQILLKDSKNLKKVEDAYNTIHGNAQIKKFILPGWGREIKRQIDTIKGQAAEAFVKLEKEKDKTEFKAILGAFKDFESKYPWFDKAETVAGYIKNIEADIKKSKDAYDKAYTLYVGDRIDQYQKSIEEFGKVPVNSKDHKSAQQKITFLKDLIKLLEGWQENDQKRLVITEKLKKYIEDTKTIAKEDADLILRWIGKIENYDTESKERFKNALRDLKETNDIERCVRDLEGVQKEFPNSPGQRDAEKELASIKIVKEKTAEVASKIKGLIAERKYDEARTIKLKFLRNNPDWTASLLPEIPLYVQSFPGNAVIMVDGKETPIIDWKGKDSVEVEVSAKGFETVKRTVKKEKGKNKEMVVLNRTPKFQVKTKRHFSATPLITKIGVFCPFGVGVDLYDAEGKAVWKNDALEIAVQANVDPITRTPIYLHDIERLFVLGTKIHVLETGMGQKMKEESLEDASETDLYVKKDPFIGSRYYLYFGTFSREVFSLNSDNLSKQWNVKVPGVPTGVTAYKEVLIAGGEDDAGTINFIDFRTGMHQEPVTVGNPITLPVIVKGKYVYAATRSGVIYSVDIETKQKVWETVKLTAGPAEKIVDFKIVDDKIYAVVQTDVFKVVSIPIEKGRVGELSDEFDDMEDLFKLGVSSVTHDGADMLYFTVDGGENGLSGVWAYDTVKGKVMWQYMKKGIKVFAPAIESGTVYVLTRNGEVLQFKE